MSWTAWRYQKKTVRLQKRRFREERGRRRLFLLPVIDQREALMQVFGTASLERALQICLRIQRIKCRLGSPSPEGRFRRKHIRGRNYHHLTPRFRRGAPYHGNTWQNLLHIRMERHEAWHHYFGLLTLEEVIAVLVRRRRMPPWLLVAIDCNDAARIPPRQKRRYRSLHCRAQFAAPSSLSEIL